MRKERIKVIGGGLAGVEAAYRLLQEGFSVDLYEMRPKTMTPAHKTGGLAELVCSNSLKSEDLSSPQGALKAEMRILDSLVLRAAEMSRVPAGSSLGVDRRIFSESVMQILSSFTGFRLITEEVTEIEPYTITATGPLTSDKLAKKITELTGKESLSFYDAVAPIITAESVDKEKAYFMSRYGKGGADYLNAAMTKEEYDRFYNALINAETVVLKEFEKGDVFEGCMPVEIMAKRGYDALRFGPLRPVGLTKEGEERAFAVLQLRQEDKRGELFNLVGFQTNLTFAEQKRVFSLIPALENAEFVRYGVMHRNTYIDSPRALTNAYSLKSDGRIFFAGQITGVEGYMESAASGILSGINLARLLKGEEPALPPETTMTGSLTRYITDEKTEKLQPMHVSFALLPPLDKKIKDKSDRKKAYAERAIKDIEIFKNNIKRR